MAMFFAESDLVQCTASTQSHSRLVLKLSQSSSANTTTTPESTDKAYCIPWSATESEAGQQATSYQTHSINKAHHELTLSPSKLFLLRLIEDSLSFLTRRSQPWFSPEPFSPSCLSHLTESSQPFIPTKTS